MRCFELVCCVVNDGVGSKTLKVAKSYGIQGGTICMGKGTVSNKLLEFLDLTEMPKEIVMMIADKEIAKKAMEGISKELAFHKPNHGIGFLIPLKNFIGTKHCEYAENEAEKAVNGTMYQAIYTVVEKGQAEDVVEAAKKAGARGGTIINARGSGIHDTEKVFAMAIEPEREMVMILTASDITKTVVEAIRAQLHIDDPGHGVLFVVGVDEAYGLR